jgi:hypothetical protein
LGPTVTILLVLVIVKSVIFSVLVWVVFREDIKAYFAGKKRSEASTVPTCIYCQSQWTAAVDEGSTRWDGEELILVTTYECQHCRLPFWHIERVPAAMLQR